MKSFLLGWASVEVQVQLQVRTRFPTLCSHGIIQRSKWHFSVWKDKKGEAVSTWFSQGGGALCWHLPGGAALQAGSRSWWGWRRLVFDRRFWRSPGPPSISGPWPPDKTSRKFKNFLWSAVAWLIIHFLLLPPAAEQPAPCSAGKGRRRWIRCCRSRRHPGQPAASCHRWCWCCTALRASGGCDASPTPLPLQIEKVGRVNGALVCTSFSDKWMHQFSAPFWWVGRTGAAADGRSGMYHQHHGMY